MIELFEYQQLLCATDGFSAGRIIGKGSHGWVYKGILEDNRVVAVKKPLLESNYLKVENEARVLWSLRQSPLVVNFLGTTLDSPTNKNKLLVMEFMPNGSLHDLLLAPAPAPAPITWHRRLHIITQIARAVHSLHQADPLVIHRDIKAENILFDSNWNLKLADFGLAVSDCGGKPAGAIGGSDKPAGTMGYLDPSYTTASKLSTKSDVFSFGVVVLEVISGRKAMDISKSPASIVEWARALLEEKNYEGIYDERMAAMPKWAEGKVRKAVELAGRCVCVEQWLRPSMGEIVEVMEMEIMTGCWPGCIVQLFQPRELFRFRIRRLRRKKKGKKLDGLGQLLC